MTKPKGQDQTPIGLAFRFFNEVGIINQLSTAMLARALPDGVHPSHFAIVNHLVRLGDGKTPIRIAGAMQVTKMTMTHSLKVLTDRGFITTEPNPEDARGKLVFLTEAGRAFHAQALQHLGAEFSGYFSEEHLATMAKLLPELEPIRRHLDENRP